MHKVRPEDAHINIRIVKKNTNNISVSLIIKVLNNQLVYKLTFSSHRANRNSLFIWHVTKVSKYYKSREETCKAINHCSNYTISEKEIINVTVDYCLSLKSNKLCKFKFH